MHRERKSIQLFVYKHKRLEYYTHTILITFDNCLLGTNHIILKMYKKGVSLLFKDFIII